MPGRVQATIPRALVLSAAQGALTAPLSFAEKLKFTPPPQPLQCMEFDKEVTVSCSATGREKPTIQWTKTGKRGGGRLGCSMSASDLGPQDLCVDPRPTRVKRRFCGCLVAQCSLRHCCIPLLASCRREQPAIPRQSQCRHLVLPQGEQERLGELHVHRLQQPARRDPCHRAARGRR